MRSKTKNFIVLSAVAIFLVGCEGGDVNISPTTTDNSQDNSETTTNIDQGTEGRLVVVIAHRLSTIRRTDRIVFLEEGTIRETGTHESMMADEDSPYRRFVELQNE